jgi:DNA-binding MarR family transcriptional regulator
MEKEYEVLEHIAQDNRLTQRKLAEKTGLSLGSMNILIKRLVKKGLVKVEKVENKTLRYMLTPKGLIEKTKLVYDYIVISYNYISELNRKIKKSILSNQAIEIVYIYGKKDEVFNIVQNAITDIGLKWSLLDEDSLKQLGKLDNYTLLVWEVDVANLLMEKEIKFINILEA